MSKDLRRPNLPFRIPNALFTSRRATSLKKIELFLILWRVSRVSERGQKRQGKRKRCVALNFSHFCDDWTVTENPSVVDRCKPSIKDIDQWLSCVYCKCIEEQSNWIPSGFILEVAFDWVVIAISASYIIQGIPYFSEKNRSRD